MNRLITKNGAEYVEQPLQSVLKHLSNVKRSTIKISPSKLHLSTKESAVPNELFLLVRNGSTSRYPVRKCFLKKLMRWYKLQEHITDKLSPDTVVAIGNDFLSNIKSNDVIIRTEDDEALTILSPKYSEFSDKELLEICSSQLDINSVSRDDYALRITSAEKVRMQPVPGDDCGFGFNIFNSETGFMAIQVAHFILRYICSNGAVVRCDESQAPIYHYNQSRDKILEYIMIGIEGIEKNREVIMSKLTALNDKPALNIIKNVRMQLGNIIGLSEASELISDFSNFARENDTKSEYYDSIYSLLNFITHNAKNRSLMQKIQMEEFAGKLILN